MKMKKSAAFPLENQLIKISLNKNAITSKKELVKS